MKSHNKSFDVCNITWLRKCKLLLFSYLRYLCLPSGSNFLSLARYENVVTIKLRFIVHSLIILPHTFFSISLLSTIKRFFRNTITQSKSARSLTNFLFLNLSSRTMWKYIKRKIWEKTQDTVYIWSSNKKQTDFHAYLNPKTLSRRRYVNC